MTNQITEEYRANARKCWSWAEAAREPENRQAFAELAQTWEAAALRLKQSAFKPDVPGADAVSVTVDLT